MGDMLCLHSAGYCKYLAIYERQKVSAVPKKEYGSFLENDEKLADMYGKNIQLFRKNKAEIDYERLDYDFVKVCEIIEGNGSGDCAKGGFAAVNSRCFSAGIYCFSWVKRIYYK